MTTQQGPLGLQGWVDPIQMLTPETLPRQSAHQQFWGTVMQAQKVLEQAKTETPQTETQLRQQIIRSIRAFEQVSGLKLSSIGLVRHNVSETAEILQVTAEIQEVRT